MTMQMSGAPDPLALKDAAKHPRGLYTLFFTEMWERASYYGMRAILVLFLVASVAKGGLGLDDKSAAAIYGVYTACVYLFALPGGWIADRLLGLRRAVWYGGLIITAGHFSMALPWTETFFLGLVLIVLGTGLLKPSISGIVGELYKGDTGARRDAGFSIYYMGINLGAIMGPLICGYLGENVNWHYGFAASGIGMALGLLQYRLSQKHLDDAGEYTPPAIDDTVRQQFNRRAWSFVWIGTGLFMAFVIAAMMGLVTINAGAIAAQGTAVIVVLFVLDFIYIYRGGITDVEKKRLWAAAVLYLFSALFWAGFEQSGSSFNLFAERYTDRFFGTWEMPASWLQSFNPLFIILLAPFFANLWVRLGVRNLDPSSPVKFTIALLGLGIGFAVMALAANYVVSGQQVLPSWLIMTYLIFTMAELCISPIGLSLTTKLAPKGYAAQMLGLFFMSSSIGNLFAGIIAGRLGHDSVADMPGLFGQMFIFCAGAAVLLYLIRKPLSRLMGGIR